MLLLHCCYHFFCYSYPLRPILPSQHPHDEEHHHFFICKTMVQSTLGSAANPPRHSKWAGCFYLLGSSVGKTTVLRNRSWRFLWVAVAVVGNLYLCKLVIFFEQFGDTVAAHKSFVAMLCTAKPVGMFRFGTWRSLTDAETKSHNSTWPVAVASRHSALQVSNKKKKKDKNHNNF